MLSPSIHPSVLDSFYFRQAELADAEKVTDFARQIFCETFAPFNTPENMAHYLQHSLTTEKIREELKDPGNIFMVLEHHNQIVAYYKLQEAFDRNDASIPLNVLEQPSMLLERFYVASNWHGSGIARHLMQHCVEFVKSRNKNILWLGVWEKNLRALKFYQSWGFEIVGSHPFKMGNEIQTDYWMSLSLIEDAALPEQLSIIEVNAAPQYLKAVQTLFREYQESRGLPLDFQGFDQEIESLPGKFIPPSGALYIALWNQQPMGCVAFYEWATGICELKRLFVKPEAQGKSIGRKLMECAIQDAKNAGYQFMRLDSLRRFEAAGKLYPKLGFYEIPPYNDNPYSDVYYMEFRL